MRDFQLGHADRLKLWAEQLKDLSDWQERWAFLLSALGEFPEDLVRHSLEHRCILAALLLIDQTPLYRKLSGDHRTLDVLVELDRFYAPLGGVVGYQAEALAHLRSEEESGEEIDYCEPDWTDLRSDSLQRREAILEGIRRMPQMAEIYPIGGAGDRFGLRDEETGLPLPVACLEYGGECLLAELFRDLEARESLYRELMGAEVVTPVVLMTSRQGDNCAHIVRLCERFDWFGRPRSSFFFVSQPSVPVVRDTGEWVETESGSLLMRPGGHGVLWKVMEEQGAYEWLAEWGRSRALVRQINNPLSGTDCTLLALSGLGWLGDKSFGFAGCPRIVGASEGMLVSFQRYTEAGVECGLSNIEYTDFARCHLEEASSEVDSARSRFPANTNILFADLPTVRRVARHHPFPGRLVNLSKKLQTHTGSVTGGRLETTMQNIADHITASPGEPLPTFATYGDRNKTISVTKRAYQPGSSTEETPFGCHHQQLCGYDALLRECGFTLPELGSVEQYVEARPGYLFQLNPSLGPLWSVIVQKVRSGVLAEGAHLALLAPTLDLEGVEVSGSLSIEGEGSISLRSVKVDNAGLDWRGSQPFWRNELQYRERATLFVHKGGELEMAGVELKGHFSLVVAEGERVVVRRDHNGGISVERSRLQRPPWCWRYGVDEGHRIVLTKE